MELSTNTAASLFWVLSLQSTGHVVWNDPQKLLFGEQLQDLNLILHDAATFPSRTIISVATGFGECILQFFWYNAAEICSIRQMTSLEAMLCIIWPDSCQYFSLQHQLQTENPFFHWYFQCWHMFLKAGNSSSMCSPSLFSTRRSELCLGQHTLSHLLIAYLKNQLMQVVLCFPPLYPPPISLLLCFPLILLLSLNSTRLLTSISILCLSVSNLHSCSSCHLLYYSSHLTSPSSILSDVSPLS